MSTLAAGSVPASGSDAPSTKPAGPEGDRPGSPRKPVTIRTLYRMMERGERFACLTCYDFTTARWLERAGVPLLLVGDTAAEMILGLPGTIHAPLDFLIQLNAAVKRGAPGSYVMADMPFMSYQADDAEALRNAGRFMTEGLADGVKLELDRSFAPLVEKMTRAGVPVIAHVGCKPQHVKHHGGYRSVGRTADEARQMVADAVALSQAGAVMLLIEAAPNEVSQVIVEKTRVPVIGCGAGPACHGQIVVLQDLLALTEWQPPFATPVVKLGDQIVAAAGEWLKKVKSNDLGPHPYAMMEGEREKL